MYVCISLFLGLQLWHLEFPRLGAQSELQLLAYATATAAWEPGIQAILVTYTIAHSNARSLTH